MSGFAFSFAFLTGGSPFVTFSIGISLIKVLSLNIIREQLVPDLMVRMAEAEDVRFHGFPGADSVYAIICVSYVVEPRTSFNR